MEPKRTPSEAGLISREITTGAQGRIPKTCSTTSGENHAIVTGRYANRGEHRSPTLHKPPTYQHPNMKKRLLKTLFLVVVAMAVIGTAVIPAAGIVAMPVGADHAENNTDDDGLLNELNNRLGSYV